LKASIAAAIAASQMGLGHVFAAELLAWDRSSMPIVYYVNAGDAAAWPEGAGAMIRSFMSWERIPGTFLRFQYGGTTAKRGAYDDGENVVTWVREGWRYGRDTVAFAILWVSPADGRIVEADILLNGEDFVWATDGSPRALDVQNVTTHEVGHALGLGHSVTSTNVTMFPVIVPGETKKRLISEEERLIIKLVYPGGASRVITYSLSSGDGYLLAERAVAEYASSPELQRIFLLTRLDVDHDGYDEVGILQEKDGRLGFFVFRAASSDNSSPELLSYDEWSIPGGDNIDLTALDIDGDGWHEIGALKAESDGTCALYVYDSPVPFGFTEDDAPAMLLRHPFRTAGGDNILAAIGLDYDADGIDEVGAVRLTPGGQYFFDVHDVAGTNDESHDEVVSIYLGSSFPFVDLDVTDIDGEVELLSLWKDNRGWYISAFELPDRSAPPEQLQARSIATTAFLFPPGHTPVRLSSLRIAGDEGEPRAAICVLMRQNP